MPHVANNVSGEYRARSQLSCAVQVGRKPPTLWYLGGGIRIGVHLDFPRCLAAKHYGNRALRFGWHMAPSHGGLHMNAQQPCARPESAMPGLPPGNPSEEATHRLGACRHHPRLRLPALRDVFLGQRRLQRAALRKWPLLCECKEVAGEVRRSMYSPAISPPTRRAGR